MASIDEMDYYYSRTEKEYVETGKVYFQCINRARSENSGNKCLAKAHYFPEIKSI